MSDQVLTNCTFDEINIGQSAVLQRTLEDRDIELFAAVTGDVNPTHLDAGYAQQHIGGIVGHSMWGASLISKLLGNDLPGPGSVYRSQQLEFVRSVALGDTLTVSVTVSGKDAGNQTVILDCLGLNQRHERVFAGTATVQAPTSKTTMVAPDMPEVTLQHRDGYAELLARCGPLDAVVTAVAHPCDAASLSGAVQAAAAGLVQPILVGPAGRIHAAAEAAQLDISLCRIEDVEHSHAAAARAVELIRAGEAEILMKGSLHTDELMGAVVSSKTGLRTARRISHAFIMAVPTYAKLLIVTDAAINIFPDLDIKRDICQNAIDIAHVLGIERPLVALLSAVETVTGKIPSTIEAAALCKMADRGQITGGVLDGPLALDNAISPEAAATKGIDSPVAGQADILLAPDLESANILAKQLTFLANADAAGIVLGARVPIILTSRADDVRTRMASCAVAALQAHRRRQAGAGARA